MADSNKAHQKKVKIEELLRVKRAERPEKTFWRDFDRELHQRMLWILVRKDPWYIQLLRSASGRIGQTVAMMAAAAVVAMMVVPPAFVATTNPAGSQLASPISSVQPMEVAVSDLDAAVALDFRMESISPVSDDMTYTPDYSMESFEVAGYEREAYAFDFVVFAAAGVGTGFAY